MSEVRCKIGFKKWNARG